jgi:hypothetical protein
MSGRLDRARTGGPSGSLYPTSRVNDSRHVVGDQYMSRPRFGSNPPAKELERERVWGKTPYTRAQRKDLTFLFAEQKRLRDALRRQARLVKLDEASVCSTEVEHLRVLNLMILDAVPSVEGVENPFRHRKVTTAQMLSEDMVARQGKRFEPSTARSKSTTGSSRHPVSRRKRAETAKKSPTLAPLEDLFRLRGPLTREFSRAVARGYHGTPEC